MTRKNAITVFLTAAQRKRLNAVARALGWGSNVAGYVHQWVGVGVQGVERSRMFKRATSPDYNVCMTTKRLADKQREDEEMKRQKGRKYARLRAHRTSGTKGLQSTKH